MSVYIYIYIQIERERERGTETSVCACVSIIYPKLEPCTNGTSTSGHFPMPAVAEPALNTSEDPA